MNLKVDMNALLMYRKVEFLQHMQIQEVTTG